MTNAIRLTRKIVNEIEPDETRLGQDLRLLATYLTKIGSDVNLAFKGRLERHPELEKQAKLVQTTLRKYRLTYKANEEDSHNFNRLNRPLLKLAHAYPEEFLATAIMQSPGNYDERRFWYCANQHQFFLEHCRPELKGAEPPINRQWAETLGLKEAKFSTSLILSDVYPLLLTHEEPKLKIICALRRSIQYSDSDVYKDWVQKNYQQLNQEIDLNQIQFLDNSGNLKKRLRKRFRVRNTEENLIETSIDGFIHWWKMTGLRWDIGCENVDLR